METSDLIIAEAVRAAIAQSAVLRWAEVVAVDGQVITCDIDGIDVPNIPAIGSYVAPLVGDRAWLIKQNTTWVAYGSNTILDIGSVANVSFHFHQASPASTWSITHNLGFRPAVTVVDSGGTMVEGSVVHASDNALTITFTAGGVPNAFSGDAYMS